MISPPRTKPAIGEVSIGSTTFGHKTRVPFQHRPVAMRGGDRRAAESADERVTGTGRQARPTRSMIFQANAAMSAQSTVVIVTTFVSTKPLPIVEATAPPKSAPVRLNNAAIAIACRGVSTLVETTVAMAFAAS